MDNQPNPVQQNVPPPVNAHQSGQKNILMAVLSYLGPLVIVSYLVAKDDTFVKFHIRQGAVLFAIEVIISVLFPRMFMMVFFPLMFVLPIVNIALLVLSIVGIVNAVQGKEKELPLVGHLAVHVPL